MGYPFRSAGELTPAIALRIIFGGVAGLVMGALIGLRIFIPGAADQIYFSVDVGSLHFTARDGKGRSHGPLAVWLLRDGGWRGENAAQ